MNILVIHCRYRIFGGEDRVVADDAALLREMGHNVITYTLSNEVLNEMGIAARIRSVIDYLYPVKQRRGIIRMIKKHSADVIWVHNTLWMYGTAPYEAGRICGVPVIKTVHNYRLLCPNGICYRKGSICRDCIGKFPKGLHNAIFRRCYRNSAVLTAAIALNIKKQHKALRNNIRIVCVSEHQRKLLLGSVKGLNPKGVYIKRNSINAAHPFRPYGERGNRFLYAGRLTESKGIKELLTAWKSIEMKMNGDAPGLVICGAGELSEYIDRYISENRLRHVINQGELPKDKVHALMADSKALIYPTRWFEGSPVAITEAYDEGTPVIGTDIGGVSEMISDGVTGRKLSYDDTVRDMVDIITDWDNEFCYDPDAIRDFSDIFSKESSVKAIKAILKL